MSYFSSNIVGELRDKLDKYSLETKESFMWRVLSLPDIFSLNNLSQEEQNFLKRALAQTCEINYERLAGSINFYLSNKIAYNKFKHGLSILPLISSASSDAKVGSIVALDRERKKPEHTANLLLLKGSFFPKDFEWYNTMCLVSVGKENLKRYIEISESIYDFVAFIVQNSLLYADNCGVNYLPIKLLKDNKVEPWLYVRHHTQDVIEEIKAIYSKVLPNIHISLRRVGRFEFNLGKKASEKLAKLLKFVGSAVIWASDENIEAPNFLSEAKML